MSDPVVAALGDQKLDEVDLDAGKADGVDQAQVEDVKPPVDGTEADQEIVLNEGSAAVEPTTVSMQKEVRPCRPWVA